MSPSESYYNQQQLWGADPEAYQRQVRWDLLDLMPPDVRSVLDVGCGDGFITNALPPALRVVGLDISPEALRHVTRQTQVGSITDLPFEDGAFDLVMTNDVLEHLAEEAYPRALSELQRVAGRYVLVTTPHREQLQAQWARCADCGAVYHLNRHQRAFDLDRMRALLAPGMQPVEVRYSGDVVLPPPDPTVGIRHGFGAYATWDKGVCPDCGSHGQIARDPDAPHLRLLNAAYFLHCVRTVHLRGVWNDRTEIIGLFAKTPAPLPAPKPGPPEDSASLLRIDFANPLQTVGRGFVRGSPWARFQTPAGTELASDGLRRAADAPDSLVIPLRIPIEPQAQDVFRLSASATGDGAGLTVYGVNGVTHVRHVLCDTDVSGQGRIIDKIIPDRLVPDAYGGIFEVHLRGPVVLHWLDYAPSGGPAPHGPLLRIEPGGNVIHGPGGATTVSWSLASDRAGAYPKCDLDAGAPESAETSATELIDELILWLQSSRIDRPLLLARADRLQRELLEAQSALDRRSGLKGIARRICGWLRKRRWPNSRANKPKQE